MRAKKGEPLKFLQRLIGYVGDECVTWPFMTNSDGGANIKGSKTAYRLMCEMAHGEPPTDKHHATHSCGKGHEACVNPNHLEWGTVFKNQQDRVKHGTSNRGEQHGLHKLTSEHVIEIFRRLNDGERPSLLAPEYNVNRVTIYDIKSGRRWAWLTGLNNPSERDTEGNLIRLAA